MPFGGGPTGTMAGDIADMILDCNARILADDILAIRLVPIGQARSRYYAVFVNGQYTGTNYYVGLIDQDILIPLGQNSNVGSLWIEDAGHWPAFDPDVYVPSARAIIQEALTAQNILFKWSSTYQVTSITGDSQLSITSISGAARGKNVAKVNAINTRGRLTYSIVTTGTTHIVRFWNDGTLVAEGSRTGNGSITCGPMNDSGLTVIVVLTYTADIPDGVAIVDLRWPEAYQIHYSTSALSFPRSPQITVKDNGGDDYIMPSPTLANGTYNWTVIEVDDEGIVQSSGIPTPTALVVNSAPDSPTITSVTGTAAALTVHWSGGSLGSTYTVYASLVNDPVNYGRFTLPAPIVTAANATSQVLAAVTGYAAVSVQTEIDTLEDAFDDEVVLMNAAFSAGETGFASQITSSQTNLINAIETYAEDIGACAFGQKDALNSMFANVSNRELYLAGLGLSTSTWQNDIGLQYAPFLSSLGDLLKHQPGRYTLPNGAIGGAASGSATVGTGANPDGTAGLSIPSIADALEDLAIPITRTGHVRVVVRGTLGGVQETADRQYIVELADDGSIVLSRPPTPNIQDAEVISLGGGNYRISVAAQVLNDNNSTVPDQLQLFATAPGAIDPTSPQTTISLAAPVSGTQNATITYTVNTTGWFEIRTASVASGTQGYLSDPHYLYVASDGTAAVNNLRATVTRGRSTLNGPGT